MPQIAYINGWGGGLNQSLASKDIEDNELAASLNMELTATQALRKRDGTSLADNGATLASSTLKSLVTYQRNNGSEVVIGTYGNKIYRTAPADPGSHTLTDITGVAITMSNNSDWDWAVMDDKLYGVDGQAATSTNPIVIADHTTDAAVATATAPDSFPRGKFITTFARRLWIVDATAPNTLHYSGLGDALMWDTSSGAANAGSIVVGQDEGDYITGIMPWLDRLIIFKRKRIYMLIPGSPNTDRTQFNMKLLTDRLGCVDWRTIQQVLNDVIFLSDYGVASLQATQQFGDLRQAILSAKVPNIAESAKNVNWASVVLPHKQQYWLTNNGTDVVWVMDFSQTFSGGPFAWMKFDGDVVGASYAVAENAGMTQLYIGNADLVVYDPDVFDDQDTTDTSDAYFRTKAYSLNEPLRRKEFYKFGVEFEAESDPVNFDISYRLDQNDGRIKTVSGSFSSLSTGSVLDGDDLLWDVPLTSGSFYLATGVSEDTDLVWPIRGKAGRRAQTIQYIFTHGTAAQGFKVKRMMFVFDFLRNLWGVDDYDPSS